MGIVLGLLSFILVLVCLLLGLLVLIQLPKKEAGFGMAFGAGAVDTLLGAGGGNALTKITKWVAGIFLGLCLLLSFVNSRVHNASSGAKGVREAATAAAAAATTPAVSPALAPSPAVPTTNAVVPATAWPAATNAPAAK